MKIKGIKFWELHIERFVLAFAVLLFVAVMAMQFVGEPNAVPAPTGKGIPATLTKITPGNVDAVLADQARAIADGISGGSSLSIPPPQPLVPQFKQRLTAAVSPSPKLAAWAPSLTVDRSVLPEKGRPFAVAAVPVPQSVITEQFFDTLAPETISEHAELRDVVPDAPHDITWVTAAAKFDAGALLAQFKSPSGSDGVALPGMWYNDRVDVIDVKIERQELVNGQWSSAALLQPIPGQFSFRPRMGARIDVAARNEILASAGDPAVRAQIIQPEFYDGLAHAWSPPSDDPNRVGSPSGSPVQDDPAAEWSELLAMKKKDQERLKKKIEELGCPTEEEPKPQPRKPGSNPPAPRGPGSGDGGIAGGGGGGIRSGGDPNDKKVDERLCRQLRNRLKGILAEITRIEAKLAELKAPPAQAQQAPEPAQEAQVRVWGHDLTVHPGRTYRYRFVVEVYNPLFARKLDLVESQQPLADQFTLASQPSEWSEPVTVQPPLRLFITQANTSATNLAGPGAAPVSSQAIAEIFRYHDSRWWVHSFTINPGDRVGGTPPTRLSRKGPEISFATDWFLLDVVEELGADPQDTKRGFGARVVLQSLASDDVQQARNPRDDYSSLERQKLRQSVRSADLAGAVSSAGTTG